jgi:hypothetical protein
MKSAYLAVIRRCLPKSLVIIVALATGCIEDDPICPDANTDTDDIEPNSMTDIPAEDPLRQGATGPGEPKPETSERGVKLERAINKAPPPPKPAPGERASPLR